MSLPRSASLALLALLLPSTALAVDAAVPPLIAKGVDPLVVLNLTSLISSEADFLGTFDNVNQLSKMPATLTVPCLSNTACLNKIAKDNGVDMLIVGQATPTGGKYDFKLVYYDAPKNRVVRTTSFTLPDSPAAIADGMGGYVREVVTGNAPASSEPTQLAGVSTADLYEDEDDFTAVSTGGGTRPIQTSTGPGRALEDEVDEEELAAQRAVAQRAEAEAKRRAEEDARRRAAEEEARRVAEAEARRRAEEEARAEAARQAAEAARRAEEEEEARRAAEARRLASSRSVPPPPPVEDEDDDFANFSLSSSVSVVSDASTDPGPAAEDEDLGILPSSESSSSSSRSSSSRSTPSRSSSSSSSSIDDLDEPSSSSSRSSSRSSSSSSSSRSSSSRSSSLDDLDEPSTSRSSGSTSRSSSSRDREPTERASSSRDEPARIKREPSERDASVLLAGRLGFAPYQGLGFVTYGAEVGYLVTGGLALVGGVEAYSVQRTIPPANLEPGEPARQWNTILPLNVGLQYHIGQGKAQPYLGADLLIVPGIVRNSTTPAMGGRGRLGANFFVSDTVALNLNGAVGFLGGKDISSIAEGMSNGAVAPQVSGGTVLFF